MNSQADAEFWIPDKETYNKLQKLIRFIDFVTGLKYSTSEDKTQAEEIKLLIENMDKPETFFKEWCVCLNIFDPVIQQKKGTGIYWREWSAYLESGFLEVESTAHILDEDGYVDEENFFSAIIFFNKDIQCKRIYMETDLDEFIEDAMNYKNYLTEAFNDIEVDIEIWN